MKTLHVEVIPHEYQRYETCGDYFTVDGVEHFRVSEFDDERHNHLIMIHEIVERILCYHQGITNAAIDAFDNHFEDQRKSGEVSDTAEPGDETKSPYHRQHQIATLIERIVALELGVNWEQYQSATPLGN